MFDCVPEPVWNTTSGNSSSQRPSITSCAARTMSAALSGASSPSSTFARAAHCLTSPNARMTGRPQPKRATPIGKLSMERCVCAPHRRAARPGRRPVRPFRCGWAGCSWPSHPPGAAPCRRHDTKRRPGPSIARPVSPWAGASRGGRARRASAPPSRPAACARCRRATSARSARAYPARCPRCRRPRGRSSCFAIMLPDSRSGTSRMSATPATGETISLVRAASGDTALSNASGPSRMPPVIWPRSAILHSAAACSVDSIFGLTVSAAERIATFGSGLPRTCARSIAFWQMSALHARSGAMLIAASVIISVRG